MDEVQVTRIHEEFCHPMRTNYNESLYGLGVSNVGIHLTGNSA